MYVIGKDTKTDKARRRLEDMSLMEQADYYLKNNSWVAYYATCYKLGLITAEECSRLKMGVIRRAVK